MAETSRELRKEELWKAGCYPLPMACYPTWAALLKEWILDKTYGTLERACARAAVLQDVKIPASVVFLGNQPIPTYVVVSPRR
jgi:hypothetical protein